MNLSFIEMLKALKANPQSMRLHAEVLKDQLQTDNKTKKNSTDLLGKDIEKQKQRLRNAKVLMLDGELTSFEYKEIKVEIEEELHKLESKLLQDSSGSSNHVAKITASLNMLLNLDSLYLQADVAQKQKIVGSIFPEKLLFENKQYRTARVNSVVSLICINDQPSKGDKKKKHIISDVLPSKVVPTGIEPSFS